MVENAIYRYKTIIARDMRSRTLVGQRVEVRLACRILNTMARLGIPTATEWREPLSEDGEAPLSSEPYTNAT